MKEGETLKLNIESYDINGYGVSHYDSIVIFVLGAMKDEVVIAKIESVHKRFVFASLVRILEKSPKRIEEKCKFASLCGGCDMLHIPYDVELEIKKNRVKQTLKDFDYKLNDVIKSDNIYGYRNKVMMPFRRDLEEDMVYYGFYEKKTHKIIQMDQCIISDDKTNEIIDFINKYLNIFHVSIYDEEMHQGLFREVMIRRTIYNEYMVVLIVYKEFDLSRLIEFLTKEFECIKSIYLNINSNENNVLLSDNFKLLYGNNTIKENILGLNFNVSPSSFMQVNHDQTEKLYSEALKLAKLEKNMNVIDAYCGMGSITLNIAKYVNHVYGIEIVESAIKNAISNMELNNINNATFICGKCEDKIRELVNLGNIDVIFFDPPRKGCDIKFLETVIEMKIPKIIYISCNISTAARDIKILEKNGYKLEEVTPVDMFSKTLHVETICLLNRRND